MAETTADERIEWEYEGAVSIVFVPTDDPLDGIAKPFLKKLGFSYRSYRHKDDIASCGHIKIQGINSFSHYGVRIMKDTQSFIGYSRIERIVTADGKILWERPLGSDKN